MSTFSLADLFSPLAQVPQRFALRLSSRPPLQRPSFSALAGQDQARLPRFVRESAVATRYLNLLGTLDWDNFPERAGHRFWPDVTPLSLSALAAAYLVKLDQHMPHMPALRRYLAEHPALVWVLGFPLTPSRQFSWGFDVAASLPTHRHLSRLLRTVPNAAFQFLLDNTVQQIRAELCTEVKDFGQTISLDTKHILAWVKENNPKAYLKKGDRYDKDQQPNGDPDCRLGCKRRHNQRTAKAPPPTPQEDPVPANTISVGEYYWGYGSGVVVTKVPEWGEFVLAELTQPFNRPDVAYFHPLMDETERRLGFRPKFGAFDAAFDAFYVYAHFYREDEDGFAAVPFSQRGGHKKTFDEAGLPLCQAGLAMPLKYTFWSKSSLVHHERGRHVCPLLFPEETGEACPIDHKNWPKGCTTTLPTSIGARIRYQLDRESEAYKQVYKQRTATERINAQAVALGIERPKLRNSISIANHNTLIYVLINLHALQRIRQRKAARSARTDEDSAQASDT
jgi:hypothetical protein